MKHDITIVHTVKQSDIAEDEICGLIDYILKDQSIDVPVSLSVTFTDDEEVHKLNAEYRGIDRTTDVLSFALTDPDEIALHDPSFGDLELGDIILSVPTVEKQAPLYSPSVHDEYLLLITHGVLHLLGYDHIEDDEAAVMEAAQQRIVESFTYDEQTA